MTEQVRQNSDAEAPDSDFVARYARRFHAALEHFGPPDGTPDYLARLSWISPFVLS